MKYFMNDPKDGELSEEDLDQVSGGSAPPPRGDD